MMDRRLIVGLLTAGAVGLGVLADPASPVMLVPAVALMFGAGWAWAGLLNLIVTRDYCTAAETATGMTQAGVFVDSVLGPAVFGLIAEVSGFSLAWLATAGAMLLAAAIMMVSDRSVRPVRSLREELL